MLGFLIAAAAGFITPQLEGPIVKPIVAMLDPHIPIKPEETRLIAFLAALLMATIICAMFDAGSAFGIIVGAILGYFGVRIYNALKKIIEGRSNSD